MEAIGARLAEVRKRRMAVLFSLAAALVVVLVLGVALGAVYVPILTSARILLSRIPWMGRLIHQDWTEAQRTIILSVRLPRVLLALLVGMALALAGTVFQGLFRNPMADPSIIGSSQGAALGATLAFFFRDQAKLGWTLGRIPAGFRGFAGGGSGGIWHRPHRGAGLYLLPAAGRHRRIVLPGLHRLAADGGQRRSHAQHLLLVDGRSDQR